MRLLSSFYCLILFHFGISQNNAGAIVFVVDGNETYLLLADHKNGGERYNNRGWAGFGGKVESKKHNGISILAAALETCEESNGVFPVDTTTLSQTDPSIYKGFALYFLKAESKLEISVFDEELPEGHQCKQVPVERGPFAWFAWSEIDSALTQYQKGKRKISIPDNLTNAKSNSTYYFNEFLESILEAKSKEKIPWIKK